MEEILRRLGEIDTELRAIHTEAGDAALTDDQQTRWTALETEQAGLEARKADVERRNAVVDALPEARTAVDRPTPRTPALHTEDDPFEVLEGRGSGMSEREHRRALVDANLRAIESKIEDGANQAHFERVLKRHALSQKAGDVAWAAGLLARSRPDYESGFAKLMMGRAETLTNEERTAMSVGTSANGGYLVPTHLDPTIILTSAGSANVLRQFARVVTLTEGKTWHGVTSAGVTASYDAELAEVSDDTPTVGNPSVTTQKAQSLVQASIEAFEDISGLASDVLMMFADARDVLEGNKFSVGAGSGSNEPRGIFTALDANTNVEVTSTTAATIGLVDIHGLYAAVPQRFRGRGSWYLNPTYNLAIKALGAAVSASYSTDLTQAPSDRILGRPVHESDDAPATQTTTVRDNEVVYGDFSNFVIADKPGSMSVEFIPHLFNTATNLPDGRRGWYAYWRSGSDSVNDLAFRLLQDKTSA